MIFPLFSGSNNARLAGMLRQLALYYHKDANNLFMVRLAQVGPQLILADNDFNRPSKLEFK